MKLINSLKLYAKKFARNQEGVTAIEYAIVAAGVAAVVMVIFAGNGPVASMLNNTFNTLGSKLSNIINA